MYVSSDGTPKRVAEVAVSVAAARDDLTEAVLGLSRALVGIALRTVSDEANDVTLVQFRALITLYDHNGLRVADLASLLHVNSSTATRMATRLSRKGLLTQSTDTEDRRATRLEITPLGEALVHAVTARRQTAISQIAQRIPDDRQAAMVEAMQAFAGAAGVGPEQEWTPGWTS